MSDEERNKNLEALPDDAFDGFAKHYKDKMRNMTSEERFELRRQTSIDMYHLNRDENGFVVYTSVQWNPNPLEIIDACMSDEEREKYHYNI